MGTEENFLHSRKRGQRKRITRSEVQRKHLTKRDEAMTPREQASLDSRLIEAAHRGDTKAVQVLLASGANVHAQDDMALLLAAENGHTEVVKVLLASDAHVHATNDFALRLAAEHGHTQTVQALLAASADVHARDDYALRFAAYRGRTEMVKVLARHIFAPDVWREKSRTEIDAHATALYNKIKDNKPSSPIKPDDLYKAGTILADCALCCWEQVRPPPPKLTISALPAQPRPV